MQGWFSDLPPYPTERIPQVRTLYLLGRLTDEDLFDISVSMPLVQEIDRLYDCDGYSVTGALWIDCFAEIDINSSMDTHVYCVQAHNSDKNEGVHFR